MVQADVRPEDYAALRRLGQQGAITLTDVGVGVDPNALWFNLAPSGRHTPAYLAADGIPSGDFERRE